MKMTARPRPWAGCAEAESRIAATTHPPLLGKAFVVAHDELGLDLLHGVHGHADNDQQRRAAKIKRDVEAFENQAREMRVKPRTDQQKVVQFDGSNNPLRTMA